MCAVIVVRGYFGGRVRVLDRERSQGYGSEHISLNESTKCSGQFLRNQSTHQNREVDVIKSQKKPITNTVNYVKNSKREKTTKREREVHYVSGDYDRVLLIEVTVHYVGRDLLFIQVKSNR